MDYEELYAIIPKSHWLWTIQDTLMWLDHIGLHALKSKFCNTSIIKNSVQSTAAYYPV